MSSVRPPTCCATPGLSPVTLQPKEGLALVNGTQAHTALAALALHDAHAAVERVARHRRGHARGVVRHAGRLRRAHPRRCAGSSGSSGQRRSCANCCRTARSASRTALDDPRVQDAYALRCMPQVHGPVLDALEFAEGVVARELNAATDNPLVFEDGEMLSGGNFHGSSVGMALRLPLDRAHQPQHDLRASHRPPGASRPQPGIAAVPHDRRRRQLRLHDGAGDRGRHHVASARCSSHPATRRLDPHRREQGRRRADGDGRGGQAAPHRPERAARARGRVVVRDAGDRLPAPAAVERGDRAGARACCARSSRRWGATAYSPPTLRRRPLLIDEGALDECLPPGYRQQTSSCPRREDAMTSMLPAHAGPREVRAPRGSRALLQGVAAGGRAPHADEQPRSRRRRAPR